MCVCVRVCTCVYLCVLVCVTGTTVGVPAALPLLRVVDTGALLHAGLPSAHPQVAPEDGGAAPGGAAVAGCRFRGMCLAPCA